MTGTAVAEQTGSPVERYVERVLPPGKRSDIRAALPAHVPFERFERNLANAVMAQPRLRDCHPNDVFFEVMKLAALGLLLDPQLGEAYLIADSKKQVQARVGYRGLLKLAKQSDVVANVYAHDICENDRCSIDLGTNKRIDHKVDFMRPRGDVGAFYAVVEFKDGPPDFEVMTLDEVNAIRDRSDAWKAFQRGAIKSTPWGTDHGEMAKKTVLRRLLKRVPMAPERAEALAALLAREDAAEFGHMRDVTPHRPDVVGALRNARLGDASHHIDEEAGQEQNERDGGESRPAGDRHEVAGRPRGGPVDPTKHYLVGEARQPSAAEGQGAPQDQHDLQPPQEDDPDAEGGEPPTEAYLRGREMRRQGVSAKAVPGEYRDDEQAIADWRAGWSDENDAQKGAAQ